MMNALFWLAPIAALIALSTAVIFYYQVKNKENGNKLMMEIAQKIYLAALSYLKQQYKVVGIIIMIMSVLLAVAGYIFNVQSLWTWAAFLSGAFFSGLSGYIGMKTATAAAPKVVQAVRTSLGDGFHIALRGGAVMGMVVTGFALLDISTWLFILNNFVEADGGLRMITITGIMLTFGAGTSVQASFARLGGGIYTKAADIGADLVGKAEHGMAEDHPLNPATIADNVGDMVGDVAGMGADLQESYAGSIIAAMVLGATAGLADVTQQMSLILFPMLIPALGIIASIAGILMTKVHDSDDMKKLVRTMNNSIITTSFIVVVGTVGITQMLGLDMSLAYCVITGIIMGIIIGELTNYYTSSAHAPTQAVAKSAEISGGLVVISGLALGMKSVFFPVIAITIGIWTSYHLPSIAMGGDIYYGLYGIAISAVGMLSTLPITLATDAYGPIVDNAGGCAEMAQLPSEVRKRTDTLDAVGNTTAAIGKGFAIGSAALTAMALLASYTEELKIALVRSGQTFLIISGENVNTSTATLPQLLTYYNVSFANSNLIIGLIIGGMLVFMFAGLCLEATYRVANILVAEVHRQIPEILAGTKQPDSNRCVAITTRGAQRAMILPASLGIISPIVVGQLLGVAGVMGLLAGTIVTGVPMAIFMANSGGAWDNAKKMIEALPNGKNSLAHLAAIIGDIVGDPFKDTAGPSINIFIKLTALVSILTVGIMSF
jgi:K(+)-stimulated pyrophosphate-energized sodium pump